MNVELDKEKQEMWLLVNKHDCKPSSFKIFKKNDVAGNQHIC